MTLSLPQQAVKNRAVSAITEKFNKTKLSKTRILTTVTHFDSVSPSPQLTQMVSKEVSSTSPSAGSAAPCPAVCKNNYSFYNKTELELV